MSDLFTDSQADIRTVEVTSWDSEASEMQAKAKEVAQKLTEHYPRHPWAVGWAPGMTLCVKLLSSPDSNYGYTIDARRAYSATNLAHMAVMAGGELLERLGMKRGAWDGEMPQQNYDGAGEHKGVIVKGDSEGFSL